MLQGTRWSKLAVDAVVIASSVLLALAIARAYEQWQQENEKVESLADVQWNDSPSTWRITGATTSSLRTGGAYLVASDSIRLDDEKTALVTYWIWPEGADNQEVY